MNTYIFNLLTAVIVAIIGAVAREFIPYLRERKEKVLFEVRRTRWEWVADIVDAAVRAVEQTVSEELHGEDKKQEAIRWIRVLLADNGLALSDTQISTMIEAAVEAMNEGRYPEAAELSPCVGSVPESAEEAEP